MLLGHLLLFPFNTQARIVVTPELTRSVQQKPATATASPTPEKSPETKPQGGQTSGQSTGTGSQQDQNGATPESGKENGITVGQPKQFDERTLTLLLQSLENQLAKSQFPDPTALYSATGRFGGATASTTSMALSVRGPSTPSVVSTIGSGNKDTTTGTVTEGTSQTATVGGATPTSTNTATTSNTVGGTSETSNTSQVVTTQPGLSPPAATLPGQTSMFSYQPQFGISAQDLLGEQTSLFYQIVNLRLLLDRSITDRLKIENIGERDTNTVKREQIVVGFQISIDAAHKDAVAEAEITLTGSEVSLVSLMPRDKTYNVASVTKDSKAIDVGAVVQFVGVGASVGKTQESLYLVKDTDTVALERATSNGGAIKFAWQFRPVLGRRTVEPGTRQVYALVSVPQDAARDLKVTAVTKWRRYDRKAKTLGTRIEDSDNEQYKDVSLVVGDAFGTESALKPFINYVTWNDIGNGQVLAVVEGDGFTPDTTIVLGNGVLNGPEKGLTVANERRMIVVTQGQLLAQSPSPPAIVGRYGTTDFVRGKCVLNDSWKPGSPSNANLGSNGGSSSSGTTAPSDTCGGRRFRENNEPYRDLTVQTPTIKARDAMSSEVTLKLVANSNTVDIKKLFDRHSPVVVIGGKVFGLSDAPYIVKKFKDGEGNEMPSVELSFLAPTQLLANSRNLIFKEFLWNQGVKSVDYSLTNAFSATGVVTLGSNSEKTQLAIVGGGFTTDVRVQVGETVFAIECFAGEPRCVSGLKLNTNDGSATVITLSPTKAQIKDVKQVLVMQGTAQPQSLKLAEPPPVTPTAKIIAPKDGLEIGEGDSLRQKFEGANFDSIKKVMFEDEELRSEPDDDDKTIRWVNITTRVTRIKGNKRLVFVMKDDKEVPFNIKVR
jgi:hypothetical protein